MQWGDTDFTIGKKVEQKRQLAEVALQVKPVFVRKDIYFID